MPKQSCSSWEVDSIGYLDVIFVLLARISLQGETCKEHWAHEKYSLFFQPRGRKIKRCDIEYEVVQEEKKWCDLLSRKCVRNSVCFG